MDTKTIEPMLAAPMKNGNITNWSDWAVEEKFDGHRAVVMVEELRVVAYGRPRGDGRMIEKKLSKKMQAELLKLPPGIYDGEMMASTGVATDVKRNDLLDETRFVMFDVQNWDGVDQTPYTYIQRRLAMARIFKESKPDPKVVSLAKSINLKGEADLVHFLGTVWDREGEGAIIKKLDSKYYVGQRAGTGGRSRRPCPLVWIKVKRPFLSILKIVGFEESRGTVMNRGSHAIVKLQDREGNETSCKTLNDEELYLFDTAVLAPKSGKHPAIGRLLVIEHYGRTRDKGYRGPVRWDRWAEDGEEWQ
jgi:ATP-dependent DNA ligase